MINHQNNLELGQVINCVGPTSSALKTIAGGFSFNETITQRNARCSLNAGGYPALANNNQAYTRPSNPNSISTDPLSGGFRTNEQVYLEYIARALEGI